jgi:DNA-directed RNA polymerase specialized sigma24 family protein
MNPHGSVTLWLERLKSGEQAALQKLWEGYFSRLVALARKKLQGVPCQVADEEDVVLSAFNSFHRCVEEGRFPQLLDRDDLWQVLVLLTVRKAANQARHACADRRGHGRVQHASALEDSEEDAGRAFADLISREPDPAVAAEVAETCRRFLEGLPTDSLRAVAMWKLEGYSTQEIAGKLGRAAVTANRKLADIREAWEKMAEK